MGPTVGAQKAKDGVDDSQQEGNAVVRPAALAVVKICKQEGRRCMVLPTTHKKRDGGC